MTNTREIDTSKNLDIVPINLEQRKVAKINTYYSTTVSKIPTIPPELEGKCILMYNYEIRKPNGEIIRVPNQLSHSFVQNFLYVLYLNAGHIFSIPVRKQDASFMNFGAGNTTYFLTTASATETTYGLQVGTGTSATTIGDYKLETLIAHGTSSGQLQYGASTVADVSSTTNTTSLILTRVFSNATAGSITVNEIAIVGSTQFSGTFMLARDVVTPIVIGVGEQLTLNYTIQTNV